MNSESEKASMNITKKIAINAILLAICIASQFFKNLSVYITGPIINLCIVLSVMMTGIGWGIILSVITPVTAFFIAGSPVTQAVPLIVPFIMAGNAVLAVMVHFFFKPAVIKEEIFISFRSAIFAILSALAKGVFMGLTISLWLIPTFIPEASPLRGKMSVFQMTFSVTQFTTALIGFVYFYIVWKAVSKVAK